MSALFDQNDMYVVKRTGVKEVVDFNKIFKRIDYCAREPTVLQVNVHALTQYVIQNLHSGITTTELDNYAAKASAELGTKHPDYLKLAARLAINNHEKNTLTSIKDKADMLYTRRLPSGEIYPLVSTEYYKFVCKNYKFLDSIIDYSRDYDFDYFGFMKQYCEGYLLAIDGAVVERPQDSLMRTAIQIHLPEDPADYMTDEVREKIRKTYALFSEGWGTAATPTKLNSGRPFASLASCYLGEMGDDTDDIMITTARNSAQISKRAGGLGWHVHKIRSKNSLIKSTNGKSKGLIPMLRILNAVIEGFDQGGTRPGNAAIYIEPHSANVRDLIVIRRESTPHKMQCFDVFPALWLSDEFMRRAERDETWYTFCETDCPGLSDVYGEEYEKLYATYQNSGKWREQFPARELLQMIFQSLKETGVPYLMFKDTVNRNNMQANIGVIKSSNLCTEIVEYSDTKEFAVCNLASICLQKFVFDSYSVDELKLPENERRVLNHEFPVYPFLDYKLLTEKVMEFATNLDQVIDRTYYPCVETARSNPRHRPIGLGVQGFHDMLLKFREPFGSDKCREVNKRVFEAIYYAALWASTKAAKEFYKKVKNEVKERGSYTYSYFTKAVMKQYPSLNEYDRTHVYTRIEDVPKDIGAYPTYKRNGGGPMSKGLFHWELYGLKPEDLSGDWDWESLREHIKIYGVRNSLSVTEMPTASTSSICKSSASIEPRMSNIYRRQVVKGDYVIVNPYLMHDLIEMNIWSNDIRENIICSNGSIQHIDGLPQQFKNIYKTAFEIKQSCLIDLAADRQPFIDQSQSLNLFVRDLTYDKFVTLLFRAWKKNLKTASYYYKTESAAMPQKFTIDPEKQKQIEDRINWETEKRLAALAVTVPSEKNNECIGCGS